MGNVEIPDWLKRLPLAPEFRPTDTEFADPIAYISKIEKEAGAFGICKIIPPLPKPSKRYVFYHLNKSLMKWSELGSDINSSGVCNALKMNSGHSGSDGKVRAVFTTRQQELGQSVKKTKEGVQSPPSGVHKQVWQSGEIYTLEQFESKSKAYARSVLGMVKEVSPLVIEAMFWEAASAKPIYVEYANDVPGSAFGELKGQSHYIKRQRRKGYYKRSLASSNCKKIEMDSIRDANTDENKDTCTQNQADTCLQTSESTAALSTLSSNEVSHSSWQENSDAGNEMEGTAGWKLSNSPWNLQFIARSPGSLTRFMPDDIPGVTSPMIYIGMLFSWFAWHVEDHELHSLNFLHTGAPKTWYAVPGDYAFTFEEVIRSEAYGGNIDHLATLTLLGEKTTLLSPEVVVMSGIPCCRLIQNPGEFVVTFPRAYHVGFSHGFNCGEAANFGTPQWLTVAKEAAVRRAAMNYLPMLSHQQLLYLLTMSFIARVPRSLLPGVRSSRLKDRQKEERELLVKKAFIEDVLHENNLLSILLEKGTTHHAVLWNADLLPDPSKHSQMPDLTSTSGTSVLEMSNICSADKSNDGYLFDKLSLSMENLTDLSLGDDDLLCHFQTDSGALACVGCGILGFPFMAVIQPSDRSLMELLPVSHHVLKDCSPNSNVSLQGSVSGNLLSVSDLPSEKELSKSSMKFGRVWNPSSKFLGPRIFCLEHALQIVDTLQGKGGVKLLVICHSDYQKIKAHARAVAEEIGSAFDYIEVPLDIASPEDLTLIDLAIDGEELDACEEDWTSKLGVNLRYCVKARKNLPSKQVPYALALGMLFSDKGHSSESFSIKWQSRRCRSKRLKHLRPAKACDGTQTKKDDQWERRIELVSASIAKKEILFQYSRRKFKSKQGCSSGRSMSHGSQEKSKNVSIVLSVDHNNQVSENDLDTENSRSDCVLSCISTSTGTKMQHENQTSDVATSIRLDMATSQLLNSIPNTMLMYGGSCTEIENQTMEEREIDGKTSLTASNLSKMHYSSDENQTSYKRKHSCSITFVTGERFETLGKNQTTEVSKCDCMDLDDTKHEQLQSSHKINKEEAASSTVSLVNQPVLASEEGCSGNPKQNYGAETNSKAMFLKETTELEIITSNRSNEELIPHYDKPIKKHTWNGENFEVPVDLSAVDLYDPVLFDAEVQEDVQIGKGDSREINLFSRLPVKGRCEYARGEQAKGLSEVILDSEKQHQDQNRNKSSEEPAPSFVLKGETESITVSEVICSQVSQEACLKGESSTQYISYRRRDREIRPKSINEVCSGTETSQMESSVSIQECSTIEKEACYIEKNGTEVHLSQDNSEWEGCELTMPASRSDGGKKRKREVDRITKDGFARSPCEGLRPRAGKVVTGKNMADTSDTVKETLETKTARKRPDFLVSQKNKNIDVKKSRKCDIDGCGMSFTTKAELQLHKRNRCPHEGCGKKFSSHKYALIHQRVHEDERPFKCPWKGCSMSFKWAWARTEHIRVHTGEKPYQCKVEGCGLSFRFVSDYSRHRRKMGHYV